MHLAKVGSQGLTLHSTSGSCGTAKNPRLERSAHEFEASLMAELLKPLQESDGLTGEDSESGGSGSEGALSGFASESLARAISERGGFGIADRILHQFESSIQGCQKGPKGGAIRARPQAFRIPADIACEEVHHGRTRSLHLCIESGEPRHRGAIPAAHGRSIQLLPRAARRA